MFAFSHGLFVVSLVAAAWLRLGRHAQRLRDVYVRILAGSKKLADPDHAHTCAHFQAGPGYGYQGKLKSVLKTEFPQMQDRVYADHAGATLYTKSQIEAVKQDLESHLFGNPHSQHGWSGNVGSAAAVATARKLTLEMCNAPLGEYECVFTAGATGALKLVGEAFPWQDGSQFVYTRDNHNSVLGIRELALDYGATASCVQIDPHKGQGFHFSAVSPPMQRPLSPHSKLSCDAIHESQPRGQGRAAAPRGPSLFAFPLESNYSGARYAPAMVNQIQTEGLVVSSQKQARELDFAQSQSQAQGTRASGQLQSGVQPASCSNHHQRDHQQQCSEVEVQQAAQRGTKEEEGHQQHQPAAEEEAPDSLSGQQGGEEEKEAGGLSSRASYSEGARWHVLIDAAKACATAPPDLTKHPADFVALSYYKIFGYPTGLGALLVHKRAVPLLMKRKRYFGGGTVAVSIAEEDFFRRRQGAAGLEDGTAHYLGIAAVTHGFRQLASLGGFPAIALHTQAVTRLFVTQLAELRHPNGSPFCVLYGSHRLSSDQPSSCSPGAVGQGPVVTFNLLRPDCAYVGYREVEKLAGLHAIFLRTGCFCNPGACSHHLGLTASQLKQNYEAGHVCWDDNDIIHGRPTGAVRVSFGWMSCDEDVHAILTFLKTCFLGTAGRQNPSWHNLHGQNLHEQDPQDQNPNTALAAPVKGPHKGQSPARHNPSRHNPIGHNPSGHNPDWHNPGVPDPTFNLNAHCSTAMPSPADSNHPSRVHSTAGSSLLTLQAQATEQDSQRTTGSSQPLYDVIVGNRTHQQPAESQQPEAVSTTHTQSAELRTSAQEEVVVQQSKGSAWLQQLPWVRCGDQVTAWTASRNDSQRLTSPSQSLSGIQHRDQSGGQLEGQPGGQHRGQYRDQHRGQPDSQPGGQHGGQPGILPGDSAWGLPLSTSTSPCTSPPQSAHSASQSAPDSDSESAVESASRSVLPSDFQHDSDSHSVPSSPHHSESQQGCSQGSLEGIWVYPVKSCGGMRVSEWPLGPNGLLLDREWALVGDDGHVLTQKGLSQMALLQPRVDLGQGFMQIRSPAMSTQLLVPLPWSGSEISPAVQDQPGATMQVRVCADNVCSLQEVVSVHSQEEVRAWFQQALGVRCCLVRQRPGSRKPIAPLQPRQQSDRDSSGHIGFANEGQFLLMNSASLADMNAHIAAKAGNRKKRTASNVGEVSRFRPNFLVGGSGIAAYAEDDWQTVCIGTPSFFTAGPCARCEMVCMDQSTGVRAGPEPLLTLASYRRQQGRVFLGILLGQSSC